jgi:hypothetical protein
MGHFGRNDFIFVSSHVKHGHTNLWCKLIGMPEILKQELFDWFHEGIKLIGNIRDRSERILYNHSSEYTLLLPNHVKSNGTTKRTSLYKHKLRVNLCRNLLVNQVWVL